MGKVKIRSKRKIIIPLIIIFSIFFLFVFLVFTLMSPFPFLHHSVSFKKLSSEELSQYKGVEIRYRSSADERGGTIYFRPSDSSPSPLPDKGGAIGFDRYSDPNYTDKAYVAGVEHLEQSPHSLTYLVISDKNFTFFIVAPFPNKDSSVNWQDHHWVGENIFLAYEDYKSDKLYLFNPSTQSFKELSGKISGEGWVKLSSMAVLSHPTKGNIFAINYCVAHGIAAGCVKKGFAVSDSDKVKEVAIMGIDEGFEWGWKEDTLFIRPKYWNKEENDIYLVDTSKL